MKNNCQVIAIMHGGSGILKIQHAQVVAICDSGIRGELIEWIWGKIGRQETESEILSFNPKGLILLKTARGCTG